MASKSFTCQLKRHSKPSDDGRERLKDIIITPNGKKRSNDENFDENGYTDDNESFEEPVRLQDQR